MELEFTMSDLEVLCLRRLGSEGFGARWWEAVECGYYVNSELLLS